LKLVERDAFGFQSRQFGRVLKAFWRRRWIIQVGKANLNVNAPDGKYMLRKHEIGDIDASG